MLASCSSILRPRILPWTARRIRWSSLRGFSVLPELLSENPILRQEILDGVLLSAIDPAGQDQEQQLLRLKRCLHVPSDAG